MRKELATLDLGTALCVGSIGGLGGVRLYEKIVYPNSRFEERTDFVTGDRIRGLTTDTRQGREVWTRLTQEQKTNRDLRYGLPLAALGLGAITLIAGATLDGEKRRRASIVQSPQWLTAVS